VNNLRQPKLVRVAVLLCCLIALAGCSRDRERASSGTFPRSETVYVGGFQWGEPTSFNPLASSPAWPVMAMNLLYEPLLVFDTLKGRPEPLLAASYEVTPDSVDVTVQPEARWSDGRPVTARDVQFTFELGRDYKAFRVATSWPFLKEVVLPELQAGLAPGAYPRRVRFMLNPERKNPLVVLDALQDTQIVPRHVFEPIFRDLKQDANELMKLSFDQNPVVSGPYTLHSYSSEKVAVVRRDDYWGNAVFFGGKKAAPKYIVHSVYKSNDNYSVALQQGRLDASSSFIPRIWLKQKKGVRAWYDEVPYFAPGAMPILFLNHTRAPLNDVHMRRAMAFAIKYQDVQELAVSGYSEPMKSGLILPFGFEARYYSEEDAAKYGATVYDPTRAKAELALGGYQPVWDERGNLLETRDRNGQRIPTLYVKCPTGWTDWESAVRIAVNGMRAVGIDARERFIDGSLHSPAVFSGDFDLIMYTPSPNQAPSKPWSRFDAILSTQDFVAPGQKMYKNMGRFNDPKSPGYMPRFDELMALIPTLSDPAEIGRAYRELNVLFMQQQPALPLVYRPDQFYEFSVRNWQGFPTAKNPYLPPHVPGSRMGTRILWGITPVQGSGS
jgi:peptide/nickel transport system substrate-binding protein